MAKKAILTQGPFFACSIFPLVAFFFPPQMTVSKVNFCTLDTGTFCVRKWMLWHKWFMVLHCFFFLAHRDGLEGTCLNLSIILMSRSVNWFTVQCTVTPNYFNNLTVKCVLEACSRVPIWSLINSPDNKQINWSPQNIFISPISSLFLPSQFYSVLWKPSWFI